MSADEPTRPSGPAKAFFAGRYELLSLLGEGGMGKVWQAKDRELGETVALKQLLAGHHGSEAIERFRDEVRLARRITHPNVIRIYDLGVADDAPYFTMEQLTGGTLHEKIKGGVEAGLALHYARQIAEGLAAAHACGVVHRDLKPSNVLLGAGDRAALSDFGIAHREGHGDAGHDSSGTPGYMAPEQQRGEPCDTRSDLYSFGVVLAQMLKGASVPREVTELIAKCRDADPVRRPSAVEAARTLSTLSNRELELPLDERPTVSERAKERTLAVLKPKVLGAAIDPAICEAFTAELIDALTRCQQLKVTGLGAVARFEHDRDPKEIGQQLKVDLVVDPALRITGDRVRIDARVLEVASGFQLFHGRFEDGLDGLLQLQETIAARIAESLRVAIIAATSKGSAPSEVMELYLRARTALNQFRLGGPDGALALLETCLAKAPSFKPGLACQALALVRSWYVPVLAPAPNVEERGREAIARCLAEAPELPESQHASALWQMQLGAYREAAAAAMRALAVAPNFAAAHELLAQLECESGRLEQGLERAQFAYSLDPTLEAAASLIATRLAMSSRGQLDAWLATHPGRHGSPLHVSRMRIATWYADRKMAREIHESIAGASPQAVALWDLYLAAAEGKVDEVRPALTKLALGSGSNVRRQTFWAGLMAEAFGSAGKKAETLFWLKESAQAALLDLDWLQRCPALELVRQEPGYADARATVRARVAKLWS